MNLFKPTNKNFMKPLELQPKPLTHALIIRISSWIPDLQHSLPCSMRNSQHSLLTTTPYPHWPPYPNPPIPVQPCHTSAQPILSPLQVSLPATLTHSRPSQPITSTSLIPQSPSHHTYQNTPYYQQS